MANKRVIELNERTQIDMNDWLLVDSSTSTRKLSIATLLSYFTYYSLIFVESLPTQDIQPNVVYLVPHSGSNTQWDEYIYINNDWSLIGTATIDLESIYQTKTDNNLQTTSKQIVGAINELKTNTSGSESAVLDNLLGDGTFGENIIYKQGKLVNVNFRYNRSLPLPDYNQGGFLTIPANYRPTTQVHCLAYGYNSAWGNFQPVPLTINTDGTIKISFAFDSSDVYMIFADINYETN